MKVKQITFRFLNCMFIACEKRNLAWYVHVYYMYLGSSKLNRCTLHCKNSSFYVQIPIHVHFYAVLLSFPHG